MDGVSACVHGGKLRHLHPPAVHAPWPPRARLQRVRHPGERQVQVPRVPVPLLQRAVLPAPQGEHRVRATPTTCAPHRCVFALPPTDGHPAAAARHSSSRPGVTSGGVQWGEHHPKPRADGTDPRQQRPRRSPRARSRRTTPTRTACASRRRTWSAFVRGVRWCCAFSRAVARPALPLACLTARPAASCPVTDPGVAAALRDATLRQAVRDVDRAVDGEAVRTPLPQCAFPCAVSHTHTPLVFLVQPPCPWRSQALAAALCEPRVHAFADRVLAVLRADGPLPPPPQQ